MLKKKSLIFFLLFYLLIQNLFADEKTAIIDKLKNMNNFSFSFEQKVNDKKETGECILVFNNKLKCDYFDDKEKEVLVNGKTLVIIQKRYNKIYYYPLSKSSFSKILNKEYLINFIKEANIQLNSNINLFIESENDQKIIISFSRKNYNLLGWKMKDGSQNLINFSLKIKNINKNYNNNIFLIPQID